jgi:hypothetical protein
LIEIMAAILKSRRNPMPKVTVNFSDSLNLVRRQVQWSPKGVSLLTKWPFAIGAEVEFAFDHDGARHSCSGVVVACRPLEAQANHYETVLYFVETPCVEAQKAACDCQLADREHRPR